MIEIPSSSLKEDCTDIPQVAQDNLDDILDDILLGQYDANFNCNQLYNVNLWYNILFCFFTPPHEAFSSVSRPLFFYGSV